MTTPNTNTAENDWQKVWVYKGTDAKTKISGEAKMKNYVNYGFQVKVSHCWNKTLVIFGNIKMRMPF